MFVNLAILMLLQEPRWWDYPGLELWKFVNLALFAGGLIYVLTRKVKLGEAFKTRRETIKQELAKAQRERDAALTKLKEVEDRLARLDSEVSTIRKQSKQEAAEERERRRKEELASMRKQQQDADAALTTKQKREAQEAQKRAAFERSREQKRREQERQAQCVIKPVMSDAEIAKCREVRGGG